MRPSEPVMICNVCGKGFLRMPKDCIDIWPVWGWTELARADGMCLGEVQMINRASAIRQAEKWEPKDGEN
jgi:hypothetical protein